MRTLSRVASNKNSYTGSDLLMNHRHLIAADPAIWPIWEDHRMAKCGSHATSDSFPNQILWNFVSMFRLPICTFSAIISNVFVYSRPTLLSLFLQYTLRLAAFNSAWPGSDVNVCPAPQGLSIRLTWPLTCSLQIISSEFICTSVCLVTPVHALSACYPLEIAVGPECNGVQKFCFRCRYSTFFFHFLNGNHVS